MKKIILGFLIISSFALAKNTIVCIETIVNEEGIKTAQICLSSSRTLVREELLLTKEYLFKTVASIQGKESLSSPSAQIKLTGFTLPRAKFFMNKLSLK